MQLRNLIVLLGMMLVMSIAPSSSATDPLQTRAGSEDAKPLIPERKSQRGDYDIEHYKVKPGDLLQIKMRGTYEVVGLEEDHLLLKPLPNQRGLLDSVWKVPKGRSHMGNHHKIVFDGLGKKDQKATVALEYKERWHWWDINF